MILFISFITIFHAGLYFVDEYILRKQRDVSQKEINSVLVDGLLFLSIVAMTIFTSYSKNLGYIYLVLSALSCISIVINEAFYPASLSCKERVIHALLYILHPLILYAFYSSWKMDFFNTNMTYWWLQLGYLVLGAKAITYHVIYWNFIHNK